MSTTSASPTQFEPVSLPKADPCVHRDLRRNRRLNTSQTHACVVSAHVRRMPRRKYTYSASVARVNLGQKFRKTVREGLNASNKVEQCSDENWELFTKRIYYLTSGETRPRRHLRQSASRLEELATQGAGRNCLFTLQRRQPLQPRLSKV